MSDECQYCAFYGREIEKLQQQNAELQKKVDELEKVGSTLSAQACDKLVSIDDGYSTCKLLKEVEQLKVFNVGIKN